MTGLTEGESNSSLKLLTNIYKNFKKKGNIKFTFLSGYIGFHSSAFQLFCVLFTYIHLLFIYFYFFGFFCGGGGGSGTHLQHMEVPRLGVKLKIGLPAYARKNPCLQPIPQLMAMPDP